MNQETNVFVALVVVLGLGRFGWSCIRGAIDGCADEKCDWEQGPQTLLLLVVPLAFMGVLACGMAASVTVYALPALKVFLW